MSVAAELQMALMSTGLVQPLDVKSKGGKLDALCRLVPGQEKAWVGAMDKLLAAAEGAALDLHVCRRYVRKNGIMVFGYHLGIEVPTAKGLKTAVELILTVLKDVRPSLTPVEAPPPPEPAVKTNTPARPPGPPGAVIGKRPDRFDPRVRVVESKTDNEGNPIIVEEMPLPHVYKELNKPDPSKGRDGRGARTISTNAR